MHTIIWVNDSTFSKIWCIPLSDESSFLAFSGRSDDWGPSFAVESVSVAMLRNGSRCTAGSKRCGCIGASAI